MTYINSDNGIIIFLSETTREASTYSFFIIFKRKKCMHKERRGHRPKNETLGKELVKLLNQLFKKILADN
jgi:hypothetical protein